MSDVIVGIDHDWEADRAVRTTLTMGGLQDMRGLDTDYLLNVLLGIPHLQLALLTTRGAIISHLLHRYEIDFSELPANPDLWDSRLSEVIRSKKEEKEAQEARAHQDALRALLMDGRALPEAEVRRITEQPTKEDASRVTGEIVPGNSHQVKEGYIRAILGLRSMYGYFVPTRANVLKKFYQAYEKARAERGEG